jgi:hypothetical protein
LINESLPNDGLHFSICSGRCDPTPPEIGQNEPGALA